MTDPRLLRRAAERAGERRFFLASALLPYARAEGLDDAGLADRLGCTPEDLPALLLCRRPGNEGGRFRMDVERIAERFGLDAANLARVIRLADALQAFGPAASDAPSGLLAAARDRDDAPDRPDDRDGAPDRPDDGVGAAPPDDEAGEADR